MIIPPFLQNGDTVGIIAPAYYARPDQWEPAVQMLQSWGLQVALGKSLYRQDRIFAGNDAQRLDDLVEMMHLPEVKAVWCARGGYGAARLLPALDRCVGDFPPKWLIGYSDITVLLTYWNQNLQQLAVHGAMPIDLSEGSPALPYWEDLRSTLFGKMPEYHLSAHPLNRQGQAVAPVTGGNLSVLCSLNGSPYQCQTAGRILFIEEVNESLYHLDRMMNSLRLSGQLAALKGLLVGSMSNMKDTTPSFGRTACEIIREQVEEYDFPLAFDFPAGHGGVNNPIVMGATMNLNVTDDGVEIENVSQ
ncbi:MAG: LD-carboxypeptidase [Bacteroidales bacterium]|jgi:muramoyltetrapeptide carboxypeptidase|nr:LD-carboxypeptidase [Bacteroidales bacterium]